MTVPATDEYTGDYPERTEVRLPRGALAALESIARRRRAKRAEIIRQTLLRGIEAEGVSL
jgi:hypothetical protein